ncbi:GNAT family N-acetyltransferase [Rothia sp. ZJ1223]|uniref:GNAT family N-acetyltransferase n=1 Tax=Rothia sp. ZJ1223 TaxID=2811098 RepID=UPI001958645F|nr:GNAT family N-acetyltransferase [Rothia sp. ZJ1223]MBM7051041.1 GNAT family N-acetyltransferase [Rothia sp. ZJ1223]
MTVFYLRPWRLEDAGELFRLYREHSDLHRQMRSLTGEGDARVLIEENFIPAKNRSVWCVEHAGNPVGLVGISFEGLCGDSYDRGWVYYWNGGTLRGLGVMKHLVKAVTDWALAYPHAQTHASLELGEYTLEVSELLAAPSPRLRRLELGYRTNNPASGAIAVFAGFRGEGREREKFVVDGEPVDVMVAGRLASDGVDGAQSASSIHHIELWTSDFAKNLPAWEALFAALGWQQESTWQNGISFTEPTANTYVVIEQSPDVSGSHQRTHAGMNHLAFTTSRALDDIRSYLTRRGWSELFAETYPYAGGQEHCALYLENEEGFEVEIVGSR